MPVAKCKFCNSFNVEDTLSLERRGHVRRCFDCNEIYFREDIKKDNDRPSPVCISVKKFLEMEEQIERYGKDIDNLTRENQQIKGAYQDREDDIDFFIKSITEIRDKVHNIPLSELADTIYKMANELIKEPSFGE